MAARGPRWVTCPNGHQYKVATPRARYRECPQCHTRFTLDPEAQRRLEEAFKAPHRPPPGPRRSIQLPPKKVDKPARARSERKGDDWWW